MGLFPTQEISQYGLVVPPLRGGDLLLGLGPDLARPVPCGAQLGPLGVCLRVDDLDGELADETVSFGLDGKRYEIDLSTANADSLRAVFAGYIAAARTGVPRTGRSTVTTARAEGSPRGNSSADRHQNRAIRAWATQRGMTIAERGRIPAEVAAAYRREHS